MFQSAAVCYSIANEGVSILENAVKEAAGSEHQRPEPAAFSVYRNLWMSTNPSSFLLSISIPQGRRRGLKSVYSTGTTCISCTGVSESVKSSTNETVSASASTSTGSAASAPSSATSRSS